MDDSFKIAQKRIAAISTSNEILCELVISFNDKVVTENIDMETGMKNMFAKVSPLPLATWFVSTIWRILYEPGPTQKSSSLPVSWIMAHDMTAAGGGFAWPNIRFVSDEKFVQIDACAQEETETECQISRYSENGSICVRRELLQTEILHFLDQICSNIPEYSKYTDLLWNFKRLKIEMADKEVAEYRIIEAMLGYDVGYAPDDIMNMLEVFHRRYGCNGIREIACAVNPVTSGDSCARIDKLRRILDFSIPRQQSEMSIPIQ